MLLFHSCESVNHVRHLLANVSQRTDEAVYATPYPQRDYGPIIVRFDAKVSDHEDYDQGGVSWTGNVCIPARNIALNSMVVLDD